MSSACWLPASQKRNIKAQALMASKISLEIKKYYGLKNISITLVAKLFIDIGLQLSESMNG